MRTKIKIFLSLSLLTAVLVISGCGCKQKNPHLYDLSLEVWGTFDYGDALNDVFENYKKINPNISSISYKKITYDTYKKELLDALAAGQGPDIFLIKNTWLSSFGDKIVPAPQVKGAPVVDELKFKSNFIDVVATDFLVDGKIYATPLSVDSLGLYYNKDIFNQAGITAPPKNWNEFIDDVRKLTKINSYGEITQAGAAIGTALNINRSTDILNLLMLQNGTKMTDEAGRADFNNSISENSGSISPAENALNFFTQFANSSSANYTWSSNMHYSVDAFAEGAAAMMFNYSWQANTIKQKAPKMNFAVAPVPQQGNSPRVNYANYWALAVAKNKIPKSDPYGSAETTTPISNETRIGEAWTFLTYLTTKPDGTFAAPAASPGAVGTVADPNFDPAKSFLVKTGEPAARRDLVEAQKNDPVIGVFATDNLIAKSWRQIDPESTEIIFAEMIDQVNKGQATVAEALKIAERRVQMLGN